MPRGRRGNSLERWEIALVKAILNRGSITDQDVLAYFTRPTRSINHRAISEIRTDRRHQDVERASSETLDAFLASWPEIDHTTGLSLRGDELLIKAREAMIAAVHTFNGAGLHFRAELFIVTSVIAWTYLHHAYYRRENVDYRFKKHAQDGTTEVAKTENGADKYWELGKCLRANKCPLNKAVKDNIEFLLELRHEIEHRSTNRIDDAVSSKLQSCAINFNDAIKQLFGPQFGLERRLPIALQFVTFSSDQREVLKRAGGLPNNVAAMMDAFHAKLTPDEAADSRFAFRVAFVPLTVSRPKNADAAYHLVQPGTEEAQDIAQVMLKDLRKYRPGHIVSMMQNAGYSLFNATRHAELWRAMDAKSPTKGYGAPVVAGGNWGWYDKWIPVVRKHCEENAIRYGKAAQP